MKDWYCESLSEEDAASLLGETYSPSYTYTLVTSLDKLVINKRDKATGEESEILIDDNIVDVESLDVPKITYTPEEIHYAINWHSIMIVIMIIAIVLTCFILRTVL